MPWHLLVTTRYHILRTSFESIAASANSRWLQSLQCWPGEKNCQQPLIFAPWSTKSKPIVFKDVQYIYIYIYVKVHLRSLKLSDWVHRRMIEQPITKWWFRPNSLVGSNSVAEGLLHGRLAQERLGHDWCTEHHGQPTNRPTDRPTHRQTNKTTMKPST